LRKILLTSSGFENQRIEKAFHGLFEKKPKDRKAIFVPTAAIDADAIAVLPKCMNDLLHTGIEPKNIMVFDLHCDMPFQALRKYDLIYFTGGDAGYLLKRINETKFNLSLNQFIESGGVYVGVSAGSMIAAGNLPNNLGYVGCTLNVHQLIGTKSGPVDPSCLSPIDLSGNNALLILGNACKVID